jgi:hypothetical protein
MRTLLISILSFLTFCAWPNEALPAGEIPAERFVGLALACVHQEYPNKIAHVMSSDEDIGPPRELTPVFYGCFDGHSAVHGHWMLVRLLRLNPGAEFAGDIEAALDRSFQDASVAQEVIYFQHDQRASFERPYGIAWFLQLMTELREWDDPRARRWQQTLIPLEAVLVDRTTSWLNKLAYPIRIGEHAQTAFAFGLFLDWADAAGNQAFRDLVTGRSRHFHLDDQNCPLNYEPGGQDFLSPCLAEADLMRRVLSGDEYAQWLGDFLPAIPVGGETDWLPLAEITDRTDGKLAHLDGLHLSRAWMLAGMAAGLPADDPRVPALLNTAAEQGRAGLASVTGEHYEGGHWLGSFATYLQTRRGNGLAWITSAGTDSTAGLIEQGVLQAQRRIQQWNHQLGAVIVMNDLATEQARKMDRAGHSYGPLGGIPVVIKDNIESLEPMPTTAGSLALATNITGRDSAVMERLRAAGLILVAKANLSEWANFRSEKSSSGWSGVGGQTRNPYATDRSPCGSSSAPGDRYGNRWLSGLPGFD